MRCFEKNWLDCSGSQVWLTNGVLRFDTMVKPYAR